MTEPNLPTYMVFVPKPSEEVDFEVPAHFFAYTETIHGISKEMREMSETVLWTEAFPINPSADYPNNYLPLIAYSAIDDAWLLVYVYIFNIQPFISSTRQIPLLEVPVDFREKANAVSIIGGFSPSVVADVIPF